MSAQPIPESGCLCASSRSLCQITSQTCCLTHQLALLTSGSLPLSALAHSHALSFLLLSLCFSCCSVWICINHLIIPDDDVLLPCSGFYQFVYSVRSGVDVRVSGLRPFRPTHASVLLYTFRSCQMRLSICQSPRPRLCD